MTARVKLRNAPHPFLVKMGEKFQSAEPFRISVDGTAIDVRLYSLSFSGGFPGVDLDLTLECEEKLSSKKKGKR